MVLGRELAFGGRVLAVTVALLPLYLTLSTIREAPFLSPQGRAMVSNPIVVACLAYGTAYAAIGDASTTLSSMFALVILMTYIFVLRPDIGETYFDMPYLKESLGSKKERPSPPPARPASSSVS